MSALTRSFLSTVLFALAACGDRAAPPASAPAPSAPSGAPTGEVAPAPRNVRYGVELDGGGGLELSGVGERGGTLRSGADAGGGSRASPSPGSASHSVGPVTVREGAPVVRGGLPVEVIQRIVRVNFGRFRLCYEGGLRTNPSLAGAIVARYTINPEGEPVDVKDAGSTLADPSVVRCVLGGFGTTSYPKPESGPVEVTYTLHFSKASGDP